MSRRKVVHLSAVLFAHAQEARILLQNGHLVSILHVIKAYYNAKTSHFEKRVVFIGHKLQGSFHSFNVLTATHMYVHSLRLSENCKINFSTWYCTQITV